MYVSFRDVASLATLGMFLAGMFIWADILQSVA